MTRRPRAPAFPAGTRGNHSCSRRHPIEGNLEFADRSGPEAKLGPGALLEAGEPMVNSPAGITPSAGSRRSLNSAEPTHFAGSGKAPARQSVEAPRGCDGVPPFRPEGIRPASAVVRTETPPNSARGGRQNHRTG
jgi:hypothetical protein